MLTRRGKAVFEREFPRQVRYLKARFDRLSQADQRSALLALEKLRSIF